MVEKFCSRSQGHPVTGVRSAAMISSSRAMSREGLSLSSVLTQKSPKSDQAELRLHHYQPQYPEHGRESRPAENEPSPIEAIITRGQGLTVGRGLARNVAQLHLDPHHGQPEYA